MFLFDLIFCVNTFEVSRLVNSCPIWYFLHGYHLSNLTADNILLGFIFVSYIILYHMHTYQINLYYKKTFVLKRKIIK